ncbi:MAG: lysine--tRNA ligase, partial [Proteobacteria bacterium]|nr:lysine--tRNA ligase [Pseudomonadota bacterium]
ILGERAPAHYFYEMFLDEKGEKISKSAGNGISIDEWLSYASAESLSYFMYQKPRTAKRLHFDVIPKAMDEYASKVSDYRWDELDEKEEVGKGMKNMMANPAFHIHGGKSPPLHEQGVSFAMLLNLATVSLAEDKDTLWKFIKKYYPEASPERYPKLDDLVGFAVHYFHDFIKPNLSYRLPDDTERKALEDLALALRDIEKAKEIMIKKNELKGQRDVALEHWSYKDREDLQKLLYAIGMTHGFILLQGWFQALYEVLLGASQGPRFGGFIVIYGVEETAVLIDKALAGDFVNS